jgi:hypothetical protein
MRKVTVNRGQASVQIIIGDPDVRDNSTKKMMISEGEAAMLLMKLKMALNGPKG